MLDYLRNQLADLRRNLRNLAARGVISLINDSGGRQVVQVRLAGGELADGVERFQNFGLSSHAPLGSEAVLVALGGDRSHLVALAVEDRASRPKGLLEGETQLYSAFEAKVYLAADGSLYIDNGKGASIVLLPDGSMEMVGNGVWLGNVSISGNLAVGGGLAVTGKLEVSGDAKIGGISFLAHRHPYGTNSTTGTPV